MSAADSRAAIERVADKRAELGAQEFAAYAFLALGILGWSAPDVLAFVLDRTDERAASRPADADAEEVGSDG